MDSSLSSPLYEAQSFSQSPSRSHEVVLDNDQQPAVTTTAVHECNQQTSARSVCIRSSSSSPTFVKLKGMRWPLLILILVITISVLLWCMSVSLSKSMPSSSPVDPVKDEREQSLPSDLGQSYYHRLSRDGADPPYKGCTADTIVHVVRQLFRRLLLTSCYPCNAAAAQTRIYSLLSYQSYLIVSVVFCSCLVFVLLSLLFCFWCLFSVSQVFSNHFDLGYHAFQPDGLLAATVMNQTLNVWLPRALQYEKDMLAFNKSHNPYNDSFVWMTQPYILSNALDCPPHMNFSCLDAHTRALVLDAMQRGVITWHAFPYNSEAELHSPDLFEYAIEMSHQLADQVGLPRPTTISQRDVPGTTQAMIPLLVKHGIRAFSIGANGWPSNADQYGMFFRWKASSDPNAEEVILLYHSAGYGGTDVHDAVIVPGFKHILITNWQTDNRGPEIAQGYLNDLTFIRQQFPTCQVKVSSFDDYVAPLYQAIQRGELPNFPVVTAEMGDTWIYGASSDPLKMAKYRALVRLRTACIADADCDSQSYAFRNFSRFVLKAAEHTWGSYWSGNWPADVETWVEQRTWAIDVPLAALPADHPIQLAAVREFAMIQPVLPDLTDYHQIFGGKGGQLTVGDYQLSIDVDGSISQLLNTATGKEYVTPGLNSFGRLLYQVWGARSIDATRVNSKSNKKNKNALVDVGDPTLTVEQPAILTAVYQSNSDDPNTLSLWIHTTLTPQMVSQYGGWTDGWVHMRFSTLIDTIDYRVTLWNKTSTKTPEGAWFIFSTPPPLALPLINKLNTWVDISNIIQGGSRHLHAADFPGVRVPHQFTVSSLDVPVVSVGYITPLPFPFGNFTDMSHARNISWSLVNNAWFTNYPEAYPYVAGDQNIQSRFHLQLM